MTGKERGDVDNRQYLTHRWLNDCVRTRVYSTSCEKLIPQNRLTHCSHCRSLLKLEAFKNHLRKKIPEDKNLVFVNQRYCGAVLGVLYSKIQGLQELVENAVSFI